MPAEMITMLLSVFAIFMVVAVLITAFEIKTLENEKEINRRLNKDE